MVKPLPPMGLADLLEFVASAPVSKDLTGAIEAAVWRRTAAQFQNFSSQPQRPLAQVRRRTGAPLQASDQRTVHTRI